MEYIDTPRTEAGNVTFMGNGHNLDDLSMENSFHSPRKREPDLVSHMRSNRGIRLRTPNTRNALTDRPNFQRNRRSGEFTPLLKSVTKRNAFAGKENVLLPNTPAFLKAGFQAKESPALQRPESSVIYGSESESFVGPHEEMTPLPQIASSSAQSTPLAALPSKTGDRMLDDQRNLMTLREQENIIDRMDKENFGLKLKIHFLEEHLRKSDPNLNQNALKENTDLQVERATLQRDLSRIKKQLTNSGREAELLKKQLQDGKERSQRDEATQELRNELSSLRRDLEAKDAEIDELQSRQESEDKDHEIERLKGDIEDLGAELRDKDRIIESKDDELEILDTKIEKNKELQVLLTETQEKVAELEKLRQEVNNLRDGAQKVNDGVQAAKEDRDNALREKEKAVDDLEELREEMANKSFTTKGLNRQIEEKANKLQTDLQALRTRHTDLQTHLDDKSREARRFQDAMEDARREAEDREQKLIDDVELLRHEKAIASRSRDVSSTEIERALEQLRAKTDEKDLLQVRHDALTLESQSLQRDLVLCRAEATLLQSDLEQERRQSLENERKIHVEAKDHASQLSDEIERLKCQLDEEKDHLATKEESFNTKLRDFKLQKDKAEQKVNGLQRTVGRLQKNEGTFSGKEVRLQEAIESEKERHKDEEMLLDRQIRELITDVNSKRESLDESRAELLRIKEELCVCKRDEQEAKEKMQALEDEVDVLQAGLEEEVRRSKEEIAKARHEAESLRHQLHANKQEIARLETAYSSARAEIELSQDQARDDPASNGDLNSRIYELQSRLSTNKIERQALQDQLAKANINVHNLQSSLDAIDLETLRHNLSSLQEREFEFARRETSYKENIRGLKREVGELESRIHQNELSRIASESSKSSVNGSVQKKEVVEVRRLLTDAQQQIKSLRARVLDVERDMVCKVADAGKVSQQRIEESEGQVEQLEQQILNLQVDQESYKAKCSSAEATITRLRDRIASLMDDLHAIRLSKVSDETIALERKDLHEMLKSAKLEAEDLQFQLTERQSRIEATAAREKETRSQLQRIRSERSYHQQKSSDLADELDNLQRRYEDKVDELATQQQHFLGERKALVSRVRFPDVSVSSLHRDASALRLVKAEAKEKEKRHGAELKGLAKQIQWLRARCKREGGFRNSLAFEKRFLLMQIEMFQTCNTADLRLLEEMGVTPDQRKRDKRPSLRAVGCAVIAGIRMQKMQKDWAVQRKLQASLAKKMEQTRSGKRSW